MYVSFDDGDHWQPLRLNLPATSIRDLIVKGDDLAIATHGRGFWILDDLSPLRQVSDGLLREGAHLFRPQTATRVRWNLNTDTPLPPDEPAGENPPDGAILHYWLGAPAEVTVEILDASGEAVRRFSSRDEAPAPGDEGNVPHWWIRPVRVPPGTAGLHRFVWDLHWPAPPVEDAGYPIAAVPGNTPKEPRGPWVLPGKYAVRLTAGGETLTQPLTVAMDPRIRTPAAGLQQQFALSMRVADALRADHDALVALRALRRRLEGRAPELQAKLAALEGSEEKDAWRGRGERPPTLVRSSARLSDLLHKAQSADVAPTPALAEAAESSIAETTQLVSRWKQLETEGTARPQ